MDFIKNIEEISKLAHNAAHNAVKISKLKESVLDIPDIGVGRMATTSTSILTLLMLESDMMDRARVLDSVIEFLKIEPEDFERMRRNDKKNERGDHHNEEPYSWEKP